MKVTNLVYAMVKLNYLKMEDPEEEIYFIYLFIYLFLFFFGGEGKLRCRNFPSQLGRKISRWVGRDGGLDCFKMSSKEKVIQSFLKMNVHLKCARSWNDWKKSEVEMFI